MYIILNICIYIIQNIYHMYTMNITSNICVCFHWIYLSGYLLFI